MSAKTLLYSSNFRAPPDISARSRAFRSELKPGGLLQVQLRVRLLSEGRGCSFRVSVRDVKSESLNISDSLPGSMKFDEALSDVVVRSEDLESSVPWWEQFPKRWVIVLLCFSAFLLCNMDRVSLMTLM